MATNPTLLTMPIAENGQKNTIPATQEAAGDGLLSQSTGFPPETALPLGAGGKAPTREDFNGAFNLLSDIAFYAQKGWTFQYDATQDYYVGCVVIDPSDGNRYECVADMTAGTVAPHSDTANTYWKEFHLGGGLPIGTIFAYGGSTNPEGALLCNGAAVSRTMYPDLFAAIGTTWGAGDGSTTFNLPRSEDLVFQGASALNPVGTYKQAGLPNITGSFNVTDLNARSTYLESNAGAFSISNARTVYSNSSGSTSQSLGTQADFDASQSNAIYGNSTTVQPPAACVNFYIQAFNASTDPALVDLTQILQDLAKRLTREQTPAFNHRDVVATSGTYTAPVTGWYRITVKGGGAGGRSGSYVSNYVGGASGGGEGGTTIGYEYMSAGDTVAVVVGAGGAGGVYGVNDNYGANGGNTSVTVHNNTFTASGGGMYGDGGTGTIIGNPGGVGYVLNDTTGKYVMGGHGGGNGGGRSGVAGTNGGGGSGGMSVYNYARDNGYAGGDGYVWFEYFAAV